MNLTYELNQIILRGVNEGAPHKPDFGIAQANLKFFFVLNSRIYTKIQIMCT